MNLTFAGTHLTNGRSTTGSSCVTGFDQAGFVMGSSASLFNVCSVFLCVLRVLTFHCSIQQILDFAHNTISQFSQNDGNALLYLLNRQLTDVRTRADDVANWPNPFQGQQIDTFQDTNATWLELIDGSSNQENIPYGPLLVNARGVDVIVTLEGSADDPVNNWPKYVTFLYIGDRALIFYILCSGTSLIFTSLRQQQFLQSSHKTFPPTPSTPDEFISTGVNARPTFFGCDPTASEDFPLVIYLPNAPPLSGIDPVTKCVQSQHSVDPI